jgi:dTDP-4-dehydrorhamnose reductase
MSKVLVTGATGLLGSFLVLFLQDRGHKVLGFGYTHSADHNANLISRDQTFRAIEGVKPDVVINLMALTNVDRCEANPHEAYLLNVKPVQNICAWIQATSNPCHLIQISSDQVYDGIGPHDEGDVTIRNHYAMSKLAGELAAGTVHSTILRTNFVGRSLRVGRSSFTDWLHTSLLGETPVNVFDDVMFSPLSSSTLCVCIEHCLVERAIGVFNLGSHDGMSKADFAFAFATATGMPTNNLVRSRVGDAANLAARRPTDMRMRCERFEKRMGVTLPRLIDEIEIVADAYR